MSRFRIVRRSLLLAALVLVGSFAWRLAATHLTGPAATAPISLDRQSAVIGVVVNGQSRAYPLRMLGTEVLDDELGGQPIVVTF